MCKTSQWNYFGEYLCTSATAVTNLSRFLPEKKFEICIFENYIKKKNSMALSQQANYTDLATTTCR
jgi:hypothetical protein